MASENDEFIGMASISNPQKEAKLVERVFIKQLGSKPAKYICQPEDCKFKADILLEKKVVVYFKIGEKDGRKVAVNVREATKAELATRTQDLEVRAANSTAQADVEVTKAQEKAIVAGVMESLEKTTSFRRRALLLLTTVEGIPEGMRTRQLAAICTQDGTIGLDKKAKKPPVLFVVGKGEAVEGDNAGQPKVAGAKKAKKEKKEKEPLPVKELTEDDKKAIIAEALTLLNAEEGKQNNIIDLRRSMSATLQGVPTRDFVELLTGSGKVEVTKEAGQRAVIQAK